MYRIRTRVWLLRTTIATAWAICTVSGQAQTSPDTSTRVSAATMGMRQAFDAAWSRQPEALALQARRDATRAQQRAAQAWTPQPMALEAFNKTDRLNENQGVYELEVGLIVPLWLPGERSGSAALADATFVAWLDGKP